MENVRKDFLLRYTDITSLMYMLRNMSITLLDPRFWDDKNDTHAITKYIKINDIKSVLVLCFTDTNETYHHWGLFAKGSSGVCIYFNKNILFNAINNIPCVMHKNVVYKTIEELKDNNISRDDLPFIKRIQYKDEREYRIIYTSKKCIRYKNIVVPVDAINKIKVNPWINERLYEHIKSEIRRIPDCVDMKVEKSRITNSDSWKRIINKL